MIGPKGMIGGAGIDDSDIFRQYDTGTNTFLFRGDSFDIQRLVDGI